MTEPTDQWGREKNEVQHLVEKFSKSFVSVLRCCRVVVTFIGFVPFQQNVRQHMEIRDVAQLKDCRSANDLLHRTATSIFYESNVEITFPTHRH